MSDVNLAIPQLLKDESGPYIPDDHGRGCSRWGITLETYRIYYPSATAADIQAMSADEAVGFYRFWWVRYNIGVIVDQHIAAKCFNIGFNIGPATAIMILQRLVGVTVDGSLGAITAAAVAKQDAVALLAQYKSALVQHYLDIVAKHPEYANDLAGWIRRANE